MSGDDAKRLPDGAPKPGDVFADKYRVERVLGIGGMGYVLAAMHLQLQERVAIKMLLPERADHPDAVARFLREGRAAVRIRSEHVARVLDVGSAAGTPYIVLEYLDGHDLAAVLRDRKRLPLKLAVDYLLQACEAIAEAHAMGTVHRDLKPANLFVVRRPDGRECIKVLDFGISKMTASDGDDVAMTRTTTTVGTPRYMSPEQLKSSKNVDARTDIWSLGVILFEFLAGSPPFRAETSAELAAQVLTTNAPDLRELLADAPEGIATVVARCLRRERSERFPSLAELTEALAPFATSEARASAGRIAYVLESVARPTSSPGVLDGPARGDAESSAMTGGSSGSRTDGTWGTATGAREEAVQTMHGRRRGSPLAAWITAGILGLVIVGGTMGVVMARFVKRSASTPTTKSEGQQASALAASPAESTIAPLPLANATGSASIPPTTSMTVPTTRAAADIALAPEVPKSAARPAAPLPSSTPAGARTSSPPPPHRKEPPSKNSDLYTP